MFSYKGLSWVGMLMLCDATNLFSRGHEEICYKNITKIQTISEVTKEPYRVRRIRFCWNLPPRCSFYATEYKDTFHEKKRIVSEEVATCCKGWKKMLGGNPLKCIPVCEEECKPYGMCIQPNVCRCNSGFNKSRCIKDDDYNNYALQRMVNLRISEDTNEPEKTLDDSTTYADDYNHEGNFSDNYNGTYSVNEHRIEMSHVEGIAKLSRVNVYPFSAEVHVKNQTDFNTRLNEFKNVTNLATIFIKNEKSSNIRSILLIFLAIFITSFILTCACLILMKVCIRRQMSSFEVKKLAIKDLHKEKSIFSSPQDGVLGTSTTTRDTATREVKNEILDDLDDILEKLERSAAMSDNAGSQCCWQCEKN